MKTLAGAIAALQAKAILISGIKEAPVNPPEAMNQFPFILTYPDSGDAIFQSDGFANYLHTLISEIHVGRQLMPKAIALALPFGDSFVAALMKDPTLGGAVSEIGRVTHNFGRLEYGNIQTIGFQFKIQIKYDLLGSDYP